jgi:hypothetical protein
MSQCNAISRLLIKFEIFLIQCFSSLEYALSKSASRIFIFSLEDIRHQTVSHQSIATNYLSIVKLATMSLAIKLWLDSHLGIHHQAPNHQVTSHKLLATSY